MSAVGFTEIPIIDIAPLFGADDRSRRLTAEALGHAAREVGFLYVTGHSVPATLSDGLVEMARRFFARPLAEKMKVYIGQSRNHRGYVPAGEEVFAAGTKDAKEAFDLGRDLPADDPDYLAGNPMLGPNQWPAVDGFAAAVGAYYNAAFAVGKALMSGFAMAMGEPADAFERLLTRPPSQLRMIHYPFNPDAADQPGIGAHTDYECFTLLLATAPGLEVLNAAGDWIDVPPLPGAYIVNIGDMLELWTNGAFIATSHRVRKTREERYSFPLFYAVDYHTRIEPMPRFVSLGNPARPGLVAGEHLFAQTAQTFTYLRNRLERGDLTLPEQSMSLSAFGQEARLAVPRVERA